MQEGMCGTSSTSHGIPPTPPPHKVTFSGLFSPVSSCMGWPVSGLLLPSHCHLQIKLATGDNCWGVGLPSSSPQLFLRRGDGATALTGSKG